MENRLFGPVPFVATAANRARTAGVGGRNFFKRAACLRELPIQCLTETVEARSKNGPIEPRLLPDVFAGILSRSLRALRHVLRLQILRIYAAVLLRERTCGFLVEVLTNAAHSPEKPLNSFLKPTTFPTRLGFVERLREPLLLKLLSRRPIERQLPLQLCNPLLDVFERVRIEVVEPAAACRHGMNNADVNPDIKRFHFGADNIELGGENNEPAAAVLVEVNLLHRARRERPVRILVCDRPRPAVADPADFRKLDAPVGVVNVVGFELRYAEAVSDVLGLEFRPLFVSGIALRPEAVSDSPVEVAERLLKRLRHRLLEKRRFVSLLPPHQLGSHLAIAEELAALSLPFVL